MFEDALLESSPRRASVLSRIRHLFSAFAGTLFLESMLIGGLVLVPLIYTQALPKQLLIGEIHISPPPGPPPSQTAGQRSKTVSHHIVDLDGAPTFIPHGIKPVAEPPQRAEREVGLGPGVIGAPPSGSVDGAWNGVIGSLLVGKEPPPPPAVARPTSHPPILRLSSGVVDAKGIYQPKPAYPPLAMMARIQGTVVLQAIIGVDGTIKDLKVVSGHPLLVRAAIDAVKPWRYQPTLLNTDPVEVLTEIDVKFTLRE